MLESVLQFAHLYGQLESDLLYHTKPSQLTMLQYKLMMLLSDNVAKIPSDIAECLSISLPNASRELRHLNDLGYINKTQDPSDKRSQLVTFSPKGRLLLDEAYQHLDEKLKVSLSHLSPEQKKTLETCFNTLSGLLSQK